MKPLTVLQFNDDKPGHYHSADAIVAAVRRLRPVEAHVVPIGRAALIAPGLLSALVNRGVRPSFILSTIYRLAPQTWPKADLIVSAGGDTIAPNIAAARHLKLPNIFFGSLRRFRAADFSLALNSYATDNPARNQITILKPSATDPDTLPPPPMDQSGRPLFAGLLVGGPAGTVRFSGSDSDRLVRLIVDTHAALGLKWIVSNSRRTPTALSDSLGMLARTPGSPVEAFIDVRSAGPGTLGRLFRDCGVLVCTADSSAMLSEAIWMRRPVISAILEDMTLPDKEADYRRRLEAQGYCRSVPLESLTAQEFASARETLRPIESNPLRDLAATLRAALPELEGGETR